MPVIARSIIKRPRKLRRCERCGGLIVGAQERLYGRAEKHDPAYAIFNHPDPATCADVERERWNRIAATNRAAELAAK